MMSGFAFSNAAITASALLIVVSALSVSSVIVVLPFADPPEAELDRPPQAANVTTAAAATAAVDNLRTAIFIGGPPGTVSSVWEPGFERFTARSQRA